MSLPAWELSLFAGGASGSAESFAAAFKFVAGALEAFGDAGFSEFQVGAGVIALFGADFAVDHEHFVVVFEHEVDDGAGEGVLGIGVDIHFDHAIFERFLELFGGGAGATVEDEVEFGFRAIFRGDGFLAIAEDFGAEFDGTGFVVSMDVTEGGGEHKAADSVESLVNGDHIFGGCVEFFVGDTGVINAVFFATDDAGFNFKDDFLSGAEGQEFTAEGHVFVEWEF